MGLEHYLGHLKREYHSGGVRPMTRTALIELRNSALRRGTYLTPIGTPIWDRNWEVLVVLDACRVDLMAEVTPEYDWIDDEAGSMKSVAGYSREWMVRTFGRYASAADLRRTGYISGNPWTLGAFDDTGIPDRLGYFDEPWRYAWDGDFGTILPKPITEQGVAAWRRRADLGIDRLVLHYMQPHIPFVHPDAPVGLHEGFEPLILGRGEPTGPKDLWARVRDGEVGRDAAWRGYRLNLRFVLDALEGTLLRNLDAGVVLTSDHGNAIGEWGFYGHGEVLVPVVKQVPWVRTEAVDERTMSPDLRTLNPEPVDIGERLRSLGYVEEASV